MKFKRASFMLVVGIALLGATFALSNKANVAHATEPATWTDGVPNLQDVGKMSTTEMADTAEVSCTPMSIPVVRISYQRLFKNNEQHCMVRSANGLADDLMTVYQPSGSDLAYPVNSKPPGSGVLHSVPMQSSALYLSSSVMGLYIGVYRDVVSSFQFNHNLLYPAYTLDNPDVYIRDANGGGLPFRWIPSFSNDGAYMIGESETYGFVRLRMSDLKMTVLAGNSPISIEGNKLNSKIAISPSGKYAAVVYTNPAAGAPHFTIVDIDSCGEAIERFNPKTTTCKSYDYWPQLAASIPNLTDVTRMEFASDNSLNFAAVKGRFSDGNYERYEISPEGQPTRLEEYLAMGDSFASGEGTFSYTIPTDTDLNKCHQSIYSYPYILNANVGSSASVACSGALLKNVVGDNGQQKSNQLKDGVFDKDISDDQKAIAIMSHIPGVVEQQRFVTIDNPQVVTISIGGNDAGFSDIIKRCIIPFNDFSSTSQNCYQTYEDRKELVDTINGQYGELVNLYKGLKSYDSTRRVYVIGYPQILSDSGSCGLNVHMSQSDRQFAVQLTSYLNSVIERAAAEAGVFYVNTEHTLDGHKLCESGDKAVNGLTAGNDKIVVGNESYHPTRLGHELLADTILAATQNLTVPMPASRIIPAPNESGLEILQAPHTGRLLYNVLSGGKDLVFALSGGIINLYSNSLLHIVHPDGVFDVVLHSNPVDLGTVKADANGVINGDVQIPTGTEPGFHTLHMYGQNMFGEPIDIQQTVYVAASADDYDGDGILNVDDSCQAYPNSGQDQDQDGIDDACDPEIGPAPVPVLTPTQDNDQSSGTPGKGANGSTPKTEDTPSNTSPIAPNFTLVNVKSITNAPKETAVFFGYLKGAATTISIPTTSATPKPQTAAKSAALPARQHQNSNHTTKVSNITVGTIVSALLIGIGAACIGGYALKRSTSPR